MRRLRLLATVLVLLIAAAVAKAPHAQAAWLDPDLERQLVAAGDDQPVRGYLLLKDRVDLNALVTGLDASSAGRARRHFAVITAYRDHAAVTQGPLLDFLAQEQHAQKGVSFRSFWIQNAVALTAPPQVYARLIGRHDVGWLFADPQIAPIAPVDVSPSAPTAAKGIEPGIEATRAPELWDLGIDGTGVLVGDMDTGCDGAHPAFAERWRGLTAAAATCWYDPAQGASFPHDYGSHGTHTMGTMIGDDGAGNAIGMAPGATWIAAAVIDVPGVDIFSEAVAAFQWFADPDGDPQTLDDVPAVVNNSWGIHNLFGGCKSQFWDAIDVAEAAGVAVVFAAGNEGPFPMSLRSPSDRIASDFNVFSVGALAQGGETIARFSSRGPSACDKTTVKPEVCAVGKNVRSSIPNGAYGKMSGTSMAAPHVSGAIALLRQAFPNAAVNDLKAALYFSARDLGDPGEDNIYGRGRIDVMAAYHFLSDSCDKDNDGHQDYACGGDDCNDLEPTVYPGAEEKCDGLDNACSGTLPADEQDADNDGYMTCQGDCEPEDPQMHPGHKEVCDGKDNNCDGILLDAEKDEDGDGIPGCAGDCRPDDPGSYPGAEEQCDGLDNDCDGWLGSGESDPDRDGYLGCADDCNDQNDSVHPQASEDCSDGIDNDCDGRIDLNDVDCFSRPPLPVDDDDNDNTGGVKDDEESSEDSKNEDEPCGC